MLFTPTQSSSEEQSARCMNYKSDTDDTLLSSILQRAAAEQNNKRKGSGPRELRTEPLTSSSSDSLPQTSSVAQNNTGRLDSTQDQHAEKQQMLLVLLAQLLRSVFTSRECLHWSSAEITLCHISLAQSDLMFNWAWKRRAVLFWYTHDTPLPLTPSPCCTSLCLSACFFVFNSIFLSLAQFLRNFCNRSGNICQELQTISLRVEDTGKPV